MSDATPTETDWRAFPALAPLLVYPNDDLAPLAAYCREVLDDPGLLEVVDAALRFLEERPRFELEELYTRTFDLNPVCTLEVGWHLYGEQYERGRFLVRARQLLSDVGQDEGGELPDFLPSLLCALALLAPDDAVDLGAYLLPAVGKMCDALEEKDEDNPYRAVLAAVRLALTARVPADAVESVESRYRPPFRAPGRDLVQLGGAHRSTAHGGQP